MNDADHPDPPRQCCLDDPEFAKFVERFMGVVVSPWQIALYRKYAADKDSEQVGR